MPPARLTSPAAQVLEGNQPGSPPLLHLGHTPQRCTLRRHTQPSVEVLPCCLYLGFGVLYWQEWVSCTGGCHARRVGVMHWWASCTGGCHAWVSAMHGWVCPSWHASFLCVAHHHRRSPGAPCHPCHMPRAGRSARVRPGSARTGWMLGCCHPRTEGSGRT